MNLAQKDTAQASRPARSQGRSFTKAQAALEIVLPTPTATAPSMRNAPNTTPTGSLPLHVFDWRIQHTFLMANSKQR